MQEFNEKLEAWINTKPSAHAGINNIQIPGQPELLVWQTRPRIPNRYEMDFVKHLMQAFSAGHIELSNLVTSLNNQGFQRECGALWTAQSFTEEMQRLGF